MITPIIVPMTVESSRVEVPVTADSSQVEVPVSAAADYRPTIIETSFPPGGAKGDLLGKQSNADYDVGWITPADAPEQDNTRPITAAAVYITVGNINALLATI